MTNTRYFDNNSMPRMQRVCNTQLGFAAVLTPSVGLSGFSYELQHAKRKHACCALALASPDPVARKQQHP